MVITLSPGRGGTRASSAILLPLLLAGCSYGVFNDLQDRAPAARIDQDSSEVSSGSFGDSLVGLDRPGDDLGGLLAIVGNGDPAFTISTLSASGKVSTAHAEAGEIDDELDRPDRINAMAPAPSRIAVGTAQGPFVYIGSMSGATGHVSVFDVSTFREVPTAFKGPTVPVTVYDFGLAVSSTRLGDNALEDDLAVGARDAVVLLRAVNDGWPLMQEDRAVVTGGIDWPLGGVSVLAAGDLDPSTSEDEVVAAVPEKNAVVVIHHVNSCFQDTLVPCQSYIKLPTPDGASLFGRSLLVADVDDDGAQELVVGAPDADRVYVYDLDAEHFDPVNPTAPPTPKTIIVQGSDDFGAALAFGKFDGGSKPLLVVGAPDTEVGGKASAGRLHLFGSDLQQIGEGVDLATPEENTMLGRRLSRVPYTMAGANEPLDLLAASGRGAVFVFFANLTASHKDVREK